MERASRQELFALREFFHATYAIRDTKTFMTHVLNALSTLIPAEIGGLLGLSPRTVDKHLERIYEKLGVETRWAAAAMAPGWCLEV